MGFSPSQLKNRRVAADLTVAEVAAGAKVGDIAVRAYEAGKRIPSVERAARIAVVLGCRVEDLLTDQPGGGS